MPLQYYEDIKPHQKYRSREYLLTEDEIISFAKQWTPRDYHIDPEAAKRSKFGGLFASAAHLFSICAKLKVETMPDQAIIASMGLNDCRLLYPARPGDSLVLEFELMPKGESKSHPDTGIIQHKGNLINQAGQIVMTSQDASLVQKRPKV
jgi:acyl dehydratase